MKRKLSFYPLRGVYLKQQSPLLNEFHITAAAFPFLLLNSSEMHCLFSLKNKLHFKLL